MLANTSQSPWRIRTARRGAPGAALLAFALAFGSQSAIAQGSGRLQGQLREFADTHGIAIAGLDVLGDAARRPVAASDPKRALSEMLHGFNYVLVTGDQGRAAEVRIIGSQALVESPAPQYAVPTKRKGDRHLVSTTVVGPSGTRKVLDLLVDTGADTIVLPRSMIELLGFRESDLREGRAQTAGGPVRVRIGRLPLVIVGRALSNDVAVSFIAEDGVPDVALLGMSFLRQYQFTLDESGDRLVLQTK